MAYTPAGASKEIYAFVPLPYSGTTLYNMKALVEPEDKKVLDREAGRLRLSLEAGVKTGKEIIAFLHYPPRYRGYECREIIELLEKYEVRRCFYGHLHGDSHKLAMEGLWGGVEYRLVAADYINFTPVTVIL